MKLGGVQETRIGRCGWNRKRSGKGTKEHLNHLFELTQRYVALQVALRDGFLEPTPHIMWVLNRNAVEYREYKRRYGLITT